MKTLHLVDEPYDSGVVHYALSSAKALSSRGHLSVIGALDGLPPARRAQSLGLRTFTYTRPWLDLGGLRRFLREESIDLLVAHTGSAHSLAVAATVAAPAGSCRVVRVRAGAQAPRRRPFSGFLWSRTAGFIAANRAILEAARPLLEPGKTPSAVIFPGVEDPGPPVPFPAGGPVIGILGRLDPVKGHEVLLQAAALILRRVPEASFLAAGREENAKTARLQDLARELGIGGRVRFLGHVADAAAFMRGCHLGVVASLGSEAVSRAAAEWLACARPLVASSVGSLPEYLEGCEGGELVPPGDPEALARAALSMLEPGRRDSAAAGARKRYEDRFSMERFGRDMERFFEGLELKGNSQ